MKIEIKNRFSGAVIFSHESESNTVAKTLAFATKSKADLRYADLRYADLSEADLSEADLSKADLRYADLRYADLRYADLSEADLSEADLRFADIRWCYGNSAQIKTLACAEWNISFSNQILAIGCQQHLIEEWRNFSDKEIDKMDAKALEWWKKWKDFIFMAIELSK